MPFLKPNWLALLDRKSPSLFKKQYSKTLEIIWLIAMPLKLSQFSGVLNPTAAGGANAPAYWAPASLIRPTPEDTSCLGPAEPYAPSTRISELIVLAHISKKREPQGRPTTLAGPGSHYVCGYGYLVPQLWNDVRGK